jgi:hypothetical protein
MCIICHSLSDIMRLGRTRKTNMWKKLSMYCMKVPLYLYMHEKVPLELGQQGLYIKRTDASQA